MTNEWNSICKTCLKNAGVTMNVIYRKEGDQFLPTLNPDRSDHHHHYPGSTQEQKMQEAYPDTAPKVTSTWKTAISDSHKAEQKAIQDKRTEEIKKAHNENIEVSYKKIEAMNNNTDAYKENTIALRELAASNLKVAEAMNRTTDLAMGKIDEMRQKQGGLPE
jgi:hypothetical protein